MCIRDSIKAYSSLEVISRKRRMEGYNVLFPIGFDAFGLPTENYAVKTGTHPRIITDENIKKFSNQLKKVGFSFDWNRVIDTTDEDYYKWTQWIFLKMFEKGLVFRDRTLVNYCPHCKVVLSNEDSQGGKCDICHSEVVQMCIRDRMQPSFQRCFIHENHSFSYFVVFYYNLAHIYCKIDILSI